MHLPLINSLGHLIICRVIDTLPKQWGRASAADYLQQLQDKQMYHQTLLTTIDDIQLMHILDPKALRQVLERVLAALHANSSVTCVCKVQQHGMTSCM